MTVVADFEEFQPVEDMTIVPVGKKGCHRRLPMTSATFLVSMEKPPRSGGDSRERDKTMKESKGKSKKVQPPKSNASQPSQKSPAASPPKPKK